MASKTTPHNTGLSIKRNGNKFTASWKLAIKEGDSKKQRIRYRTYNGKKWSKWTTKDIGKKATSYNFTLSPTAMITSVQVQTQILKDKSGFKASDWSSSSAKFAIKIPPAPALTVENTSANQTKYTWSVNSSATDSKWYYRSYYRTKCDNTPTSNTGWSPWTYASAGTYTYTDNTLGTVRTFQIYAKGPAGNSAIVTRIHVINSAPRATWADNPFSLTNMGAYYSMTYNINLNGYTEGTDTVVPQYYIGTPDGSGNVPGGASWVDGTGYSYAASQNKYALALTTTSLIGPDDCLWGRIKTVHDSIESYSDEIRILAGNLVAPSLTITMGTILATGFSVNIAVDDAGTAVPDAYMEVYLEKYSAMGLENYILIGTIANGDSSETITSTEDLTTETGYAIHVRNVTADGILMVSDYYTYATTMPTAPTLDAVSATATSGKVYLSWTNNWADATGAIIAWTDDPDNWTSNEDPEEYEVKERASNWFITGLETGQEWFFRIRSVKEVNDQQTLSPWSSDVSIDLASAPAVPVLYLSDETITEDGMVTAYWSHVSTDGTGQIAANIVTATYSGGVWTYGNPVESTTTAQHVDIYAADNGWTNGTVVYLALQTRSGSGGLSDYSTPVQLVIAAKPTVTISSTSLTASDTVTERFVGDGVSTSFLCADTMTSSPTVTVDGSAATVSSYTGGVVTLTTAPADGKEVVITYTTTDNKILDVMPFTCTVATTNSARLTVAVERAYEYPMLRPDGTQTDGSEGETVFVTTVDAESSQTITIDMPDLIGRLDDGAWYYLVATASDDFGQIVEARQLFKVHWSHQAWDPTATFITDDINYIARITPVAGPDYVSGDVCDIYRLGADAPELIISGGSFGTEYVDPYPAFGPESGYKIVTVTANDDYITEANTFAEYDTIEEDDGSYTQLDPGTLVIDFNGDRAELEYNIGLGNSWAKDFQRTTYLGGHVTGDHNRAVTRDLSATTVEVRGDNDGIAAKMRALARYAGLCHVRTPEGSSFVADVQVSENQTYNSPTIDYSLSIQKVDTVGFDGMTYAEWEDLQNEESS